MKGRKRRSQSDLMTGRSPKHRVGDGDGGDRTFGSMDMDSSSSPFDASLGKRNVKDNFYTSDIRPLILFDKLISKHLLLA